jgi:hypothetical protein
MNTKELLLGFVITFLAALGAGAIVTYLWNLILHDTGAVNWETSLALAVILGFSLPVARALRSKPMQK